MFLHQKDMARSYKLWIMHRTNSPHVQNYYSVTVQKSDGWKLWNKKRKMKVLVTQWKKCTQKKTLQNLIYNIHALIGKFLNLSSNFNKKLTSELSASHGQPLLYYYCWCLPPNSASALQWTSPYEDSITHTQKVALVPRSWHPHLHDLPLKT